MKLAFLFMCLITSIFSFSRLRRRRDLNNIVKYSCTYLHGPVEYNHNGGEDEHRYFTATKTGVKCVTDDNINKDESSCTNVKVCVWAEHPYNGTMGCMSRCKACSYITTVGKDYPLPKDELLALQKDLPSTKKYYIKLEAYHVGKQKLTENQADCAKMDSDYW